MGVISIGSLPRLETLSLAWLSPFLILGTMLRPHSLFGRFLELAPLRYIGRLSYSLYLWQQLFFVSHFGAISGKISTFQHWPLKLVMTLACSMFSYYFVERPLIRLGHRVASTSVVNRASHRGSSIEVH
jgi:peptidoglycan/LPS O-acetylase OafA/YrhL